MNRTLLNAVLVSMALAVLAACNGGSDSSESITGLSLPQKISAISAKQTTSNSQNAIQALNNSFFPTAFNDPGTDFTNDQTQSFIYDEGIRYVYSVNYLLCFIDELQYQTMVNKGPYIAVVNFKKCYEENYPNSNVTIPDLIVEATVVSSRTSNNDPHVVKIWLPEANTQDTPTQPGMIKNQTLIEIAITREPDEANPFGEFSLNYAGIEDASLYGGHIGEEKRTVYGKFQGKLNQSGEPVFQAVRTPDESIPSDNDYEAFTVLSASTGDTGAIHARSGNRENDILNASVMQYNSNRVLKGEYNPTDLTFDTNTCLARDEIRGNLFGYNLYHKNDGVFRGKTVTSGQRVEINSNFSFLYNGVYGWMSEDSYWLEHDNVLPDGAAITKDPYSSNSKQLTAFVSAGKLTRHQIIEQLMSELHNIDLIYYGWHPDSQVYGNWVVEITANNDINVIAKRTWSGTEYIESDTYDHDNNPNTVEIPVQATLALQNGQSITLYAKSDYRSYTFTYDSAIAAQDQVVTYRTEDTLNAINTDLFPIGVTQVPLYCYELCPKGGVTQAMVDDAANFYDLYYKSDFDPTEITYTAVLDGYHISLIDNNNGLPIDATHLDLSKFWQSGFGTGNLLTDHLPPSAGSTSDLPVTYLWASGAEPYYQSVVLLDENNSVYHYDEPIVIDYTYDAADDLYNTDPQTNPNHGKTFTLTYGYTGGLWGLPYITGENNDRYQEINLAPGTALSNGEGEFVVKGSWEMQFMLTKDLSECSGLSVEALINDPNMELLSSAAIQPISFAAADKPVVGDEPSVTPDTP